MSTHLILFSVDDEPHVRVVHDADEATLAVLARMVEYAHSTDARTVELLPDNDEAGIIREEYADAGGEA